jgi:hypothetical protein
MSPALLGLVWAALFAVPISLLSRLRLPVTSRSGLTSASSWKGTAWLLAISIVLLFGLNSLAFYAGRPMMTFAGLVPLILVNLVLMVITTTVFTFRRLNAGGVAAALATVTFATIWLVGHNSGHDATWPRIWST